MKFYVYDLIDPRNGEVFYVGKGTGKRAWQHEKDARKGVQSPKCQIIRDILAESLGVEIKIVKKFKDEDDAYRFEADRIAQIGLEKLANEVPGGRLPIQYDSKVRADAVKVELAAKCVAKLGKIGGPAWLNYRFAPHSEPIPDAFFDRVKQWLTEVVASRGITWVNRRAKRFGVVFETA